MDKTSKVLFLFDVDGTLTRPRHLIDDQMRSFLRKLQTVADVGLVGGSDLPKITEQMGGADVVNQFTLVSSENGLVTYKDGALVSPSVSFVKHLGETKLKKVINFCLRWIADVDIPIKRGTFIEYRTAMLNVSPIGRACSQTERDAFLAHDSEHGIRSKFVKALESEFSLFDLQFVIGGQISVDIFPVGWDKTYCLQFAKEYDTIHFFGDKCELGGNDHTIFASSRTEGHSVTSPLDTMAQIRALYPQLG